MHTDIKVSYFYGYRSWNRTLKQFSISGTFFARLLRVPLMRVLQYNI